MVDGTMLAGRIPTIILGYINLIITTKCVWYYELLYGSPYIPTIGNGQYNHLNGNYNHIVFSLFENLFEFIMKFT